MPNAMASSNWSRFGSEWNGGLIPSLCPDIRPNIRPGTRVYSLSGPLAHWGEWMGINTLRVGPLLCPDNVGMLIFESRYFFLSGFAFLFPFPFFNIFQ
jgi:hypothetical protein